MRTLWRAWARRSWFMRTRTVGPPASLFQGGPCRASAPISARARRPGRLAVGRADNRHRAVHALAPRRARVAGRAGRALGRATHRRAAARSLLADALRPGAAAAV